MNKKSSKSNKKTSPINKSILNKLLNSTIILYLVFLLTCVNIFTFIITKNDESLFLFILISIIIYEFNKNMILILGIPILIVNFLLYLKKAFNTDVEILEEEPLEEELPEEEMN